MRTFIIAIVVFAVLTIGVCAAAWHICVSCDELIALAESLPGAVDDPQNIQYEEFNDIMEKFNARWNSMRMLVRGCVGHTEAEAVDDALDEVLVRFSYSDQTEYMSARRRLITQIEKIKTSETFSLDGLF